MRAWTQMVGAGVVGWVVMAAGAVLLLVAIVALLVGSAASPTTAALLAGAGLIGLGGILTREDGMAAGMGGSVWHALAGETRTRAELAAPSVPEHLRGLLLDLARGTAAARYVELAKTLEKPMKGAGSLPDGADPVGVVAAAVTEMANASVQEAVDAVGALERRPPAVITTAGANEVTSVQPPVEAQPPA